MLGCSDKFAFDSDPTILPAFGKFGGAVHGVTFQTCA